MTPYNVIKNISIPEIYPIHGYVSGTNFWEMTLAGPESLLENVTQAHGLKHHVKVGSVLYSQPKFKCGAGRNKVLAVEVSDGTAHRNRVELIRNLADTSGLVKKLRSEGIDIPGINVRMIPMKISCGEALISYCNTYGLDMSKKEINEIKLKEAMDKYPGIKRIVEEFDGELE